MQVSRLTFGDGEYLAEVRTRQGDITDQITFLTNLRTISFGGNGGSAEDMSLPVNQTRRIVAFIGWGLGVLGRLGTITISYNWAILGPIVLLFELVEQHRASVVPLKTCLERRRIGGSAWDKICILSLRACLVMPSYFCLFLFLFFSSQRLSFFYVKASPDSKTLR